MGANPLFAVTVEQYLCLDEAAERKSEYHDGELFPIVDATPAHSRLAFNIAAILHGRLKKGCAGMIAPRVRVSLTRFVYPDAAIVGGEAQLSADSLANPRTVIEILSPLTEGFDAGGKFKLYQLLPSFEEYLLIAQDQPRVELFRKQSPIIGRWRSSRGSTRPSSSVSPKAPSPSPACTRASPSQCRRCPSARR